MVLRIAKELPQDNTYWRGFLRLGLDKALHFQLFHWQASFIIHLVVYLFKGEKKRICPA